MRRREILKVGVAILAAPFIARTAAFAGGDLELLTPGKLTAATGGTYPPFSFRNPSGELDGLEIRILTEIASRLGLSYEPVITKWESILIGLEAGQYDMTSESMAITEERQKAVTFCDGWLESGSQLFVAQDSPITDASQTKGTRLAVLTASVFVPLVESWGAEPVLYKSDVEAMQDVVNGQAAGTVTDAIAGAYMISMNKLALKSVGGLHSPYQMGWAVKKGKPNLVTAINKTRAAMVEDGTMAKIFKEMIGFDPTPAQPTKSIL